MNEFLQELKNAREMAFHQAFANLLYLQQCGSIHESLKSGEVINKLLSIMRAASDDYTQQPLPTFRDDIAAVYKKVLANSP